MISHPQSSGKINIKPSILGYYFQKAKVTRQIFLTRQKQGKGENPIRNQGEIFMPI
jgi:hypothetical protein